MTINDMILEKMKKAKCDKPENAAKVEKIASLVYGADYAKPLRQSEIKKAIAAALLQLETEGKVKNVTVRVKPADIVKTSRWMVM